MSTMPRNRVAFLRCTYCGDDAAQWRARVVVLNGAIWLRLRCQECLSVLMFKLTPGALHYLEGEGALHDEPKPKD